VRSEILIVRKDIVVCTEIKGNNNGGFTRILGAENIVKSVENGCFCGVVTTVS